MSCFYDFENPEPNFDGHRQSSLKRMKLGTIPDRDVWDPYLLRLHLLVCFIYLFDDVVSNSAKVESKYLIEEDVEEVTA